jgi:hypothetical protein
LRLSKERQAGHLKVMNVAPWVISMAWPEPKSAIAGLSIEPTASIDNDRIIALQSIQTQSLDALVLLNVFYQHAALVFL